jgi:mevalonate kinase
VELLRAKEALQQLRKDYDNLGKLHEREKLAIKTDIEAQLQQLIDLNQDALGSLQAKEKELTAMTANYEQAVLKNREATAQLFALSESF